MQNMKEQLRAMLMTAKMLQFFADIFAVFGVLLFGFIYFNKYSNNADAALRDPTFIISILMPFVPAAFLAFLASRHRRKVRVFLEQAAKQA